MAGMGLVLIHQSGMVVGDGRRSISWKRVLSGLRSSSPLSPRGATPPTADDLGKIVVARWVRVGKTTLVGSVSEIVPLTTEAVMTEASVDVDDLSNTRTKVTTTVAMDFGRVSLDSDLILYLFGYAGSAPLLVHVGRPRTRAIGRSCWSTTRRLADAFASIDFFEDRGLP